MNDIEKTETSTEQQNEEQITRERFILPPPPPPPKKNPFGKVPSSQSILEDVQDIPDTLSEDNQDSSSTSTQNTLENSSSEVLSSTWQNTFDSSTETLTSSDQRSLGSLGSPSEDIVLPDVTIVDSNQEINSEQSSSEQGVELISVTDQPVIPKPPPISKKSRYLSGEIKSQCEWDDFEDKYLDWVNNEDTFLKKKLACPNSIVGFVLQKRDPRTEDMNVPPEFLKEDITEPFIRDSIKIFTTPWKVVYYGKDDPYFVKPTNKRHTLQFKKHNAAGRLTLDSISKSYQLGTTIYDEIPNPEGENILDETILQDQDFLIESDRKFIEKVRSNLLFRTIPVSSKDHIGSSVRQFTPPFPEKYRTRILIEAKELTFQLTQINNNIPIEPFFCTLSIHDIKKREKLSEDFHFHLNPPDLLSPHTFKTNVTRSIFFLGDSDINIFFILKIYKLLRGDIEKDTAPYMKARGIRKKEIDKLISETKELLKFRSDTFVLQPFVWSAIPIFDSTGTLKLEPTTAFHSLYSSKNISTDEHICENLTNENHMQRLKKNSLVPGHFIVEIERLEEEEDEIVGRVDPSYCPVKPFTSTEENVSIIKEIHDFTESQQPMIDFVNNIFVYPLTMKFTSVSSILVEVKLKDKDNDPNSEGLPSIYSKYGYEDFEKVGLTSVTAHEKKGMYMEEIKIKLGLLTPHHHLLFTFYQVNPTDKKSKQSIIGYSVLPLLHEGKIKSGKFYLPIATELPPSYNNPNLEGFIKWDENKKNLFSVRVEPNSSVFTYDDSLSKFWRGYHNPEWASIALSCVSDEKISEENKNVWIHFVPVICNQLISVLCLFDEKLGLEALVGLITVSKRVKQISDDKTTQNTHLVSFVRYVLDIPKNSVRPLHEAICSHWRTLIRTSHPCLKGYTLSWFLLDLMVKSMALHVEEKNFLSDDHNRRERFTHDYEKNLTALLKSLFFDDKNLDAMSTFPMLCRDLLSLMDRGIIFKLIYDYFSYLSKEDAALNATFKFRFLGIISEYEYLVPVNLPTPVEELQSISEVFPIFMQNHFLITVMVKEVSSSLSQKKALRTQGILLLRNTLRRLETDERYQTQACQERIAGMFFPFIFSLIENLHIVTNELDQNERYDWLLCFSYIIKNSSKNLIRSWLNKETQKHQNSFLTLLNQCLSLFTDSLNLDVSLAVLEVCTNFMKDFEEDINKPSHPLLEKLFLIFKKLLENTSSSLINSVYLTIKQLVTLYATTLFKYVTNTNFLEDLCFQILKHCNCNHQGVRSRSTAMCYLLMQKNHQVVGTFTRIKASTAVAVSRLVGEGVLSDYTNLYQSLQVLNSYAREKDVSSDFSKQVEDVTGRIHTLIKYSTQISENQFDKETVIDLYVKISEGYFDSPDLRATWLENLAALHKAHESWEQAGHCMIYLACLILRYLHRNGIELPITPKDFTSICPSIDQELGLPETTQEEGLYQSALWSMQGLVKKINSAISHFFRGRHFELCLECYGLLSLIYKADRNYTDLIDCMNKYRRVAETLVEANKDLRLFPVYYRVGFYGELFGQMDGREYIYRCPPKFNLSTIQSLIKETYALKVGGDEEKIISLPNVPVDRSKFESDKMYIQLASLKPYFDPAELEARVNQFERNWNASRFIFESGFSTVGKNASDVATQQKKKLIYKSRVPFPYIKNRLFVVEKSEIILTPIENALEGLEERVAKLRATLDLNPPRVNVLQQVLQGSVVPMVNEGPIKICEIFLKKEEEHKYEPQHVKELRKTMRTFVTLCGFAIALNKSIITPQHLPFQQMVEKHYSTMKKAIKEYTDEDESSTQANVSQRRNTTVLDV